MSELIEVDNDDLLELAKQLVFSRPTGKVTWLTKNGTYELDYNFDPPRVKKIEEDNDE